ncbi:pseudaminic acid synthase [Motilimonas sp. 1_MG-2023]|uniref:pseudaminic acid synthase n=1 Tax=Motilimonas TaxID=1914248 RepID=UPI0026E12A2D|nr:pseudaminic acid synthase [Motilimonas sp. 1_MG-2023]MDO6524965.1 pseudaminic acid synthase [Motilimonas sp. 1_MG-2023]
MPSPMKINGRAIANGLLPYMIAEISANHNGDINNAFRLIELAKQVGADAVKIQTYTADTMTIDANQAEFKIKGGLWDGYSLYELYQQAHTPWAWHSALFAKAKQVGITLFSSPFDETAVDLLESLQAPAYKIASFESLDFPLIEYVAKTNKPMIISTGLATLDEITELQQFLTAIKHQNYCLLHCVSGYPTPVEQSNVTTLTDLQHRFQCHSGLSDHSLSHGAALAASALNAAIIEKHFTFCRSEGGPDADFSLEPNELAELCSLIKQVHLAKGKVNYERKPAEQQNLQFRRSIYAVKDIAAGEKFTEDNIKRIRPGHGLAPKYYPELIGSSAKHSIAKGTPLNFNHFTAKSTIDR